MRGVEERGRMAATILDSVTFHMHGKRWGDFHCTFEVLTFAYAHHTFQS